MSPDTKRFVDQWFASVDLKAMMLDHYRRELGVDDLSTIQMVSESEMMSSQTPGPKMAIRPDGSFLYERGPFLYRFPKRSDRSPVKP